MRDDESSSYSVTWNGDKEKVIVLEVFLGMKYLNL